MLAKYGISVRKSDGVKVIRAEDITTALRTRTDNHIGQLEGRGNGRDAVGEGTGSQGLLPAPSLPQRPCPDQEKHPTGTAGTPLRDNRETPRKPGSHRQPRGSLPGPGGGGGHD